MKPGDLQALCLRGAKAGIQHLADLLEKGLASGVLKPRDLAVVTGILTDKAIELEPLVRNEDAPLTPEQVEREMEEIDHLRAELARRRGVTNGVREAPVADAAPEAPQTPIGEDVRGDRPPGLFRR